MENIIAVEHKIGNYQGHDYDNWVLTTTQQPSGSDGKHFGVIVNTHKIKAILLQEEYKKDPNQLIGKSPEIWYDRYGNVNHIAIK